MLGRVGLLVVTHTPSGAVAPPDLPFLILSAGRPSSAMYDRAHTIRARWGGREDGGGTTYGWIGYLRRARALPTASPLPIGRGGAGDPCRAAVSIGYLRLIALTFRVGVAVMVTCYAKLL